MATTPPASASTPEILERGRHWSGVAPGYDQFFENREASLYRDLEAQLMREFLRPRPGMRILDLCSGTGRNSLPLAQAGAEVVGLDAGVGMIAEAQRKAQEQGLAGARFLNGDVCHLPFADNAFDAATGTRFMYMMSPEQKRRVIAELTRVVKPGGAITLQFNGGFWGIKHELSNYFQGKPARLRSRYLWPGGVGPLFAGLHVRHVVGVKLPLMGAVARVIGEPAARGVNRLARWPGFRFASAYLVVHAEKPR